MGKLKENSPVSFITEFPFTPNINNESRKIALQHIYGTKQSSDFNTEEANHFIQYTVAQSEPTALTKLKKVPQGILEGRSLQNQNNNSSYQCRNKSHPLESLAPIKEKKYPISQEKTLDGNVDIIVEQINPVGLIDPFVKRHSKKKNRKMMSVPEYNSDTFTFHPKVSQQSAKIAESLGTDFMARQQQHIEKQKKHIEQASQHYRAYYAQELNPGQKASRISSKDQNKLSCSKENDTDNEDSGASPTNASTNTSTQLKFVRSGTVLAPLRVPKTVLSTSVGLERLSESQTTAVLDRSPALTSRSKTMPLVETGRRKNRKPSLNTLEFDRLKNAKNMVEQAVKMGKIFTIQGPYSKVRSSLRKRGWVEKFYKMQPRAKTPPTSRKSKPDEDDDDNDDDDDDGDSSGADDFDDKEENYVPPWEEDGGIYAVMSRMIRNVAPTLIWCLRRDAVDHRSLSRDQVVNHYCRAGSFTTKVGLCMNMRNVPWFETEDPDTFFPRCYRLSADDDKEAFIADFRLTACMSLMKLIVEDYERRMNEKKRKVSASQTENNEATKEGQTVSETKDDKQDPDTKTTAADTSSKPGTSNEAEKNNTIAPNKKVLQVPFKCLEIAVSQCNRWLQAQQHLDIDRPDDPSSLSEELWDQFLRWYYQVGHEGARITNADSRVHECSVLVDKMREKFPQFDLDGTRNTWIVKPGAKSRGRGIIVSNRLEEMLKLVSGIVVKKEGKFIVQKYMERPLLVYNTKFDIRQWVLVTDWNPLTIYFYKDSYLRFCSQQFTLEKFDEAIHLANNSIQKNYTNDKTRSSKLPSYNMWTHDEFNNYLAERGCSDAWEEIILPGMKKAISCALLTSQDFVEYRKSAFELYGADFMLTEDLRPWLIEINSSPAMDPSTPITARLCAAVLDDVMKVVVDRRIDRNCDIGRFELVYRQVSVTVPPYIGINLSVDGTAIRRPGVSSLQHHPLRVAPPPPEPPPPVTQPVISPYALSLTNAKPLAIITSPRSKASSAANLTLKTFVSPFRESIKREPTQSTNLPTQSTNLPTQSTQLPTQSTHLPTKSPPKRESKKKEKSEKSSSLNGIKPSDVEKSVKSPGLYHFDVPHPQPKTNLVLSATYFRTNPLHRRVLPHKLILRNRIITNPLMKFPRSPYSNIVLDGVSKEIKLKCNSMADKIKSLSSR